MPTLARQAKEKSRRDSLDALPPEIGRLVALGLSRRQAEVYVFIFTTAQDHGFQPSYREIRAFMGVTSLNAVKLIIDRIAERGFVKRKYGEGRSLVLKFKLDGSPFRGFTCR